MRDSSERETLSTAQPCYRAQTKYCYPLNLANESLRVSSHLPLQLIRAQYPTFHVVSREHFCLNVIKLKTNKSWFPPRLPWDEPQPCLLGQSTHLCCVIWENIASFPWLTFARPFILWAIRNLNTGCNAWLLGFRLLQTSNAVRLAVQRGVSLKYPRLVCLSQLSFQPFALTLYCFHYKNRNLCPKCCYITNAKYLIPRGSNYGWALATLILLFNNNCKSNLSIFQLIKYIVYE